MKILYFSEVYPIRNSLTDFGAVVEKFILRSEKMVKSDKDFDFRVVANSATVAYLAERFGKWLPLLLSPPDALNKKIEAELVDWSESGMRQWNSYIDGDAPIAADIEQWLMSIKENVFDFDMIVCWGENSCVNNVASLLDVPCLHMELGAIRPPFRESEVFDYVGANGSSLIKSIDFKELKSLVDAPPIEYWRAVFNSPGESNTTEPGIIDGALTYFSEDIMNQVCASEKKKTVLIALQLADDTNTQRHSDFSTPKEFLESVIPVFSKHGWNMVVKGHPMAHHRPLNLVAQDDALEYAESSGCCVIDEQTSTREYAALLLSVDGVAVINSSLGFEAAMLGIPVCLSGDAVYGLSGVFPDVSQLAEGAFNLTSYRENIGVLVFFFYHYIFKLPGAWSDVESYSQCYKYWLNNKEQIRSGLLPLKEYIELFSSGTEGHGGVALNYREIYEPLSSCYKYGLNLAGGTYEIKEDLFLVKGRSLFSEVVGDSYQCFVDSFTVDGDEVQVRAWAADSDCVPPSAVLLLSKDKILHGGRVMERRPDVAKHLGASTDMFGFKFKLTVPNGQVVTSLVLLDAKGRATVITL